MRETIIFTTAVGLRATTDTPSYYPLLSSVYHLDIRLLPLLALRAHVMVRHRPSSEVWVPGHCILSGPELLLLSTCHHHWGMDHLDTKHIPTQLHCITESDHLLITRVNYLSEDSDSAPCPPAPGYKESEVPRHRHSTKTVLVLSSCGHIPPLGIRTCNTAEPRAIRTGSSNFPSGSLGVTVRVPYLAGSIPGSTLCYLYSCYSYRGHSTT